LGPARRYAINQRSSNNNCHTDRARPVSYVSLQPSCLEPSPPASIVTPLEIHQGQTTDGKIRKSKDHNDGSSNVHSIHYRNECSTALLDCKWKYLMADGEGISPSHASSRGFEPPTSGSGGLCPIQARLPVHLTLSRHQSQIINYGLWLRKEGYSKHTIYNDVNRLRRPDKQCGILD